MFRAAILMLLCGAASAHRLDEFLQASLISIAGDRITVELNLTPGVSLFADVSRWMDQDQDGRLSEQEQELYAQRVTRDVALAVDHQTVSLALLERQFPSMDAMREGLGTIRLRLRAEIATQAAGSHRLQFQNRHQPAPSVYLANALAPLHGIEIQSQNRDPQQTTIAIDYRVTGLENLPAASGGGWLQAAGLGALGALAWFLEKKSRRASA